MFNFIIRSQIVLMEFQYEWSDNLTFLSGCENVGSRDRGILSWKDILPFEISRSSFIREEIRINESSKLSFLSNLFQQLIFIWTTTFVIFISWSNLESEKLLIR